MDHVLTVIGNPASRALSKDHAEAARRSLQARGARTAAVDWLSPGVACDIPFADLVPVAALDAARQALAGQPLDLAAQAAAGRRKALLVADMESTVIAEEMLDELGERFGLGDRIAAITARSMAGELGFEESLTTRVALLAGLPEAAIDEVAARMTLNPGARTLVRTMRAGDAYTALVSGGFTVFTGTVREACGFDEDRANRLLVEDGALTGRVARPILGPRAKLDALREIAGDRELPPGPPGGPRLDRPRRPDGAALSARLPRARIRGLGGAEMENGGPTGPPLSSISAKHAARLSLQLWSRRTATHWKSPWRSTRRVTTRKPSSLACSTRSVTSPGDMTFS
jgi:phosphoserine phosphatase